MAPKGKKGKKAPVNDDWENDVLKEVEDLGGDGGASGAGAPAAGDAPSEPAAASAADMADEFDGGGLLGAIKKNRDKKKKGKGGKNATDDQMADALAALTTADGEAPPAAAAPTEATEDDFGPVGKQKKGKGGKGGNQQAAAAPPPAAEDKDDDDDGDEGTGGKVLTKKEKEKLKKEREKQRKKEQAARKKATGPAAKEEPTAAAAEESKPAADAPATPAAPEPAAAGGKKKKLNPALAALQRQQELLRQAEEERRRLEEEDKKAREEEEERAAEEEKRKEEAKQRKKEKEKEKKEQLRKEGKLLSKSQREAQQKQQLRLQQMIDAGMIVQGMVDPEAAKSKKPVYDRKKRKPGEKSKAEKEEEERKEAEARRQKEAEEHAAAALKREEDAKRKAEEEQKAAEEAEAAAAKKAAEADVLDDWDAAVDSDGNLKEDWDQESDKEEEEPKPASKGKGAVNGKKGKAAAGSDDSDESSEDEAVSAAKKATQQRREEAAKRREEQREKALAARSKDNLRSPICCILGHVDTGKTKLLDKIRQTNVQEGEAGGITQQIGATYFPGEAIKQKTQVVNEKGDFEIKVPGLLIIDTPGHESFTNLRSRGSSLCNIAILVVDIMHGLEPQTLESIRLLRDRKTPFIVALNKIDRLYGWKSTPNNGFRDSLNRQSKSVQNEFKDRLERTKLAFSEQSLNSELFYENKNMSKFVSLVPTSAHTGEGIPDMLKLILSLTQQRMTEKLMYLSELECTVLEVKIIEGLGTTIDVVLSNGVLREGDRIVLCGLNGAIATNVRALLTPQPLKELRVKGSYVHHKEIKAAMGVKIAANDLENAIAGSRLMVVGPDDDEEDLEDEVMSDLEGLLGKVTKGGKGVAVQASTLGSLEALLEFLRVSNIPVMSISIGPVYKRDVMRAGTMLEKNKELAVMLCFDVKVDKEAQAYADEVGVKIFQADIIYHLFDNFTAYQKELLEAKREESKADAVFPCVLNTVAVFHQRDPIVVGVDCVEGSLRIGTPIAAVRAGEAVVLGRVTSIELNHKAVPMIKKGSPSAAVKIEAPNQPVLGRHWEEKDALYSHISRKSIDTLKNHFREEVAKEDWQLMIQLKKVFKID